MAMTRPHAGLKSTRGQIAFVMCHEVLGVVWFVATAGIQRRCLQEYHSGKGKGILTAAYFRSFFLFNVCLWLYYLSTRDHPTLVTSLPLACNPTRHWIIILGYSCDIWICTCIEYLWININFPVGLSTWVYDLHQDMHKSLSRPHVCVLMPSLSFLTFIDDGYLMSLQTICRIKYTTSKYYVLGNCLKSLENMQIYYIHQLEHLHCAFTFVGWLPKIHMPVIIYFAD